MAAVKVLADELLADKLFGLLFAGEKKPLMRGGRSPMPDGVALLLGTCTCQFGGSDRPSLS